MPSGRRSLLTSIRSWLDSTCRSAEPTSWPTSDQARAALDLRLAGKLEEIIKGARDDGTSIVYVSHRLDEIKRLADRLTVLRDGVVQGSYSSGDWQIDDIVEMMVGRPTELEFPTRHRSARNDTRLVARDLSGLAFGPVSVEVRAGEIVGVAGAEGNGQRALLRGIIGIDRTGGETAVDGKTTRHVSPATALDAGISFQSGDRVAESTFGPVSVMGNATTQLGPAAGPLGLALGGRLLSAFNQARRELGIIAASPYQPISGLSGGNQQKTVLARPALRTPKVLILDEPTQGVDARARLDIYKVIADAADEGIGVLVNSSDSSELAGLCDRVYVMSRGKVVKELQGPTTENEIVRSFVAATTVSEEQARSADEKSTLFQRTRARLATHLPIAVLIVLITTTMIYAGIKSPVFWSSVNMTNLLVLTLPLAFVALGQQFVMIGGLLDLSVGSTMSLTVVMLSVTLPDFALSSIGITLVVLALIVLIVGGFNVLLIEVLKINPIVATIATMGIVQGVAILIRPQVGGVIATDLVDLVSKGIGFVPFGFIGLIALCIYMEYYLYRRPRGLALRGLGFNMESCYRLGERVTRLRAISLSVAAFGAVVGGVFLASQTGMGANDVGAGYSLPVFAAVFLGGAVMSGGRGSFVGAVLGALFLSLINNVTPLLGIPAASQDLIYGAILILAISVYATVNRSRGRQRT
jgi:ribose transport system ATP-binding protein